MPISKEEIEQRIDSKIQILKDELDLRRDTQAKLDAERKELLDRHNQKLQNQIVKFGIGIPIAASILSAIAAWLLATYQAQNKLSSILDVRNNEITLKEQLFKEIDDFGDEFDGKIDLLNEDVGKKLDKQKLENEALIDDSLKRLAELTDVMLDKLLEAAEESSSMLAESKQSNIQASNAMTTAIEAERIALRLEESEQHLRLRIQENSDKLSNSLRRAEEALEILGSIKQMRNMVEEISNDLDRPIEERIEVLEKRISKFQGSKQISYTLTFKEVQLTSPCESNGSGQLFHSFAVNGIPASNLSFSEHSDLPLRGSYPIDESISFELPSDEETVQLSGFVRDYDGPRYGGLLGGYKYKIVEEIDKPIQLNNFGQIQALRLGAYPTCTATLYYTLEK